MSDIQEQIKLAHKRAEKNDIKLLQEEIKKILDRLERIDHKEYIAFEFADSATFDEMARCFNERKKMANYITNLQEENKRLNNIIDELEKWAEDYRFADILKNKLNELKGDNK